jgi:hypothetical protein
MAWIIFYRKEPCRDVAERTWHFLIKLNDLLMSTSLGHVVTLPNAPGTFELSSTIY